MDSLKKRTPVEALVLGIIIVSVLLLSVVCLTAKLWVYVAPVLYVLWVFVLVYSLFSPVGYYSKEDSEKSWRKYYYYKSGFLPGDGIHTSSIETLQEYAKDKLKLTYILGPEGIKILVDKSLQDSSYGILFQYDRKGLIDKLKAEYEIEYAEDVKDLREQIAVKSAKKFDEYIRAQMLGSVIGGILILAVPVWTAFNPLHQQIPLNLLGVYAVGFGLWSCITRISEQAKITKHLDDMHPKKAGVIRKVFGTVIALPYVLYFFGVLLLKLGLF
ncbi:hypothetical protein A3K34_04785 [candidate division WWE3 bacterium RIFOXYC1_FULL_40_10]|uniref:Uncharacterized protein n=1 Tax=candidate division WWE3 bacterium RIFOXYA2_FULL_46_9 TaxID=1802636 RepID=A0A1F4W172_UNCKA|nr:MAG: hypothetical protein A3K58_04785 [candidate division WWE3 bacterium RIFOXYB1_FULL_40_22]OGC62154.1 MAG: hypothetical protein A3K37_04785 [candidate division WWE3 bacterium RIFOXYA1_FULL_40_11]OGC63167.1 MAG: hypothetical protein A2264_00530 [candidate division WWE3 bacterium RIFOXYA2_FULL_46_9]OGC65247.1 MAG: hypothetical protein A2326_04165 [candidate division WWE3 bacterium RIFOXYB2_FULL_41_6]OGC66537.1 MAG: hypothetical protein A3K34_04785 [candidate division WWE3 bacterium RIFOXYC1_